MKKKNSVNAPAITQKGKNSAIPYGITICACSYNFTNMLSAITHAVMELAADRRKPINSHQYHLFHRG